jgi:hypothetical protein
MLLNLFKPSKPPFDSDLARKEFKNFGYNTGSFIKPFSRYSPAYVVTNEDLRFVIGVKDAKNARVLTVAGSGDHPLFYRLAGAKSVDTFDLSYCARVIMNIKTAAIPVLRYDEYIKMLNCMHCATDTDHISHFARIKNKLPRDSRKFLSDMQGNKIFGAGLRLSDYMEYLPAAAEYAKMQKLIKRPFAFKWADITEVHKELTKTYDIMNLSNIFEYVREDTVYNLENMYSRSSDDGVKEAEKISGVLKNLCRHLSDNGIIAVHTTWFIRDFEHKMYTKVQENIKEWARLGVLNSRKQQTIILQKLK